MKVVVLGSGGSSGMPSIDLGWGRCDPANAKNRRTRPSILVEHNGTRILVDTAPDLRQQLLAAGVRALTAVLYTHAHADHLHGLDDLRAVNRAMRAPLPIYADAATLSEISRRFGYALAAAAGEGATFFRPTLIPHEIGDGDRFTVGDLDVTAFAQDHGFGSTTLGFRIGDIAYSTDVVELPEHAFSILRGVRVWIIGALSEKPHPTHCHVGKALDWIRRVGPSLAVLSHLGSDLDHGRLEALLPTGVRAAYDGMCVRT